MLSSPASRLPGAISTNGRDYGADGRGAEREIHGVVELPGPRCWHGRARARQYPLAAETLRELRADTAGTSQCSTPTRIADMVRRSRGNVGTAIDLSLDAARLAKESGQQAITMLALHDTVRFGDR